MPQGKTLYWHVEIAAKKPIDPLLMVSEKSNY